jgi:hypothetical protein
MSWQGPPLGPGYPQGQGQYPQQQGQYPQQQQQQPYGYPQPQPPPKKGMGAGAIVGILAGVFFLLAIVCSGVLWFFFARSDSSSASSSSTSVSADSDQSAVLKAKAEALLTAVKTKDKKQVEGPLLEFATLPETAKPWFDATFDAKSADDLYGYWNRQVNITDLVTPFKNANEAGETEVRVKRFTSMADVEACQLTFCKFMEKSNLEKLFAAMTKKQALYLVLLEKPGTGPDEDPPLDVTEVYYFAVIKGSFVYLDHMLM